MLVGKRHRSDRGRTSDDIDVEGKRIPLADCERLVRRVILELRVDPPPFGRHWRCARLDAGQPSATSAFAVPWRARTAARCNSSPCRLCGWGFTVEGAFASVRPQLNSFPKKRFGRLGGFFLWLLWRWFAFLLVRGDFKNRSLHFSEKLPSCFHLDTWQPKNPLQEFASKEEISSLEGALRHDEPCLCLTHLPGCSRLEFLGCSDSLCSHISIRR